jgi:integrase
MTPHFEPLVFQDVDELQLSTRNAYRDAINKYWLGPIRSKPVDTIRPKDLQDTDDSINWSSKKTRKNAIAAVRMVFAFAIHRSGGKLISSNPAAALSTKDAKKPRRLDPDPYTEEERDAVLGWLEANTPKSVFVFYLVGFFSGARTGELLALTWPKYDGTAFTVDPSGVRREIKGTKTDEPRRVLMPDFVCKEVNALPSRFKREWIFTNQYGRCYLSGYHLNQYLERAHVATQVRRREGPYPWRHTYASIGLTNGANPAFLAKQLGHTKAVFFSTYAKWMESDGDRRQLELAVGKRGKTWPRRMRV